MFVYCLMFPLKLAAVIEIHRSGATPIARSLDRGGMPFVKDELVFLNKCVDPTADVETLRTMTVPDLRKLIRSNIVLQHFVGRNVAQLEA